MKLTQSNNFQRVIAAARVVYRYMQVSRIDRPRLSCSTEQAMIRLVTDLRHMAEAAEIDFQAVLRASRNHYDEETW